MCCFLDKCAVSGASASAAMATAEEDQEFDDEPAYDEAGEETAQAGDGTPTQYTQAESNQPSDSDDAPDDRQQHEPSDDRQQHEPSDDRQQHEPSDDRQHEPSDDRQQHEPSDDIQQHEPSDASNSESADNLSEAVAEPASENLGGGDLEPASENQEAGDLELSTDQLEASKVLLLEAMSPQEMLSDIAEIIHEETDKVAVEEGGGADAVADALQVAGGAAGDAAEDAAGDAGAVELRLVDDSEANVAEEEAMDADMPSIETIKCEDDMPRLDGVEEEARPGGIMSVRKVEETDDECEESDTANMSLIHVITPDVQPPDMQTPDRDVQTPDVQTPPPPPGRPGDGEGEMDIDQVEDEVRPEMGADSDQVKYEVRPEVGATEEAGMMWRDDDSNPQKRFRMGEEEEVEDQVNRITEKVNQEDAEMDTSDSASFIPLTSNPQVQPPAHLDDVEHRILVALTATQQINSNDLAKRIGFKTKKEINPKLYALQRKNLVKKVEESPPVWEIAPSGRAQVQRNRGGRGGGGGASSNPSFSGFAQPGRTSNKLSDFWLQSEPASSQQAVKSATSFQAPAAPVTRQPTVREATSSFPSSASSRGRGRGIVGYFNPLRAAGPAGSNSSVPRPGFNRPAVSSVSTGGGFKPPPSPLELLKARGTYGAEGPPAPIPPAAPIPLSARPKSSALSTSAPPPPSQTTNQMPSLTPSTNQTPSLMSLHVTPGGQSSSVPPTTDFTSSQSSPFNQPTNSPVFGRAASGRSSSESGPQTSKPNLFQSSSTRIASGNPPSLGIRDSTSGKLLV